MPLITNHRDTSRFALALAAFYAAQFTVTGIQLPYFPVWLDAKGVDPVVIGATLGAPMFVRVAIIPLVTRLADRFASVRTAIVAASWLALAAFLLAASLAGREATLIAVVIALTLFGMTFPLADAYAVRELTARSRAYGPVRLWGSAAFIVSNVLAGHALGYIAPVDLIWLVIASNAAMALVALALGPGSGAESGSTPAPVPVTRSIPHRASDGPKRADTAMWRVPAFLAVVAAVSLVQASHAVYYGFSTIAWRDKGLDGTTIGVLWALGVLAEIALFALSARLPRAIGPLELIALGALGAVLRWGAMALDPAPVLLPALQILHALSFGATHLGAMQFIMRHVPTRTATAQGDLSVVQGVIMASAMALSGVLYRDHGDAAYAAMMIFAAAGLASAILARRIGRRRQVDD